MTDEPRDDAPRDDALTPPPPPDAEAAAGSAEPRSASEAEVLGQPPVEPAVSPRSDAGMGGAAPPGPPREPVVPVGDFLIGVRLRPTALAEDYRVGELALHVGDLVVVETGTGTAFGEVRRPRRPLPEARRDRLYRAVLRRATEGEVLEHRERRERERKAVATCQQAARRVRLPLKVVDVEMTPGVRRVVVYFNAEQRVDFRDLVRDLAREFRARIEMRQIGARDTTRVLDGIGPCGRQLCCASHLRHFEPISVKMAKAQDMPLTDSRLLGNCGRLKCCLLYEFSTYEALRARLPRVNTPCQATCGGGGCMSGKVRALRILKQHVVVRFADGTEAEVPLDQLTWEGRDHITLAEPPPS
jgi:cell fate regulator YaaT (PSP1 superfamily)